MCGISGIAFPFYKKDIEALPMLQRMNNALQHRGPDGSGIWHNDNRNVYLGHRRLSIIDLDESANQPMHYLHYSMVFNGEIYNFIELKKDLQNKGYTFKTQCDSEVLMALYDSYGNDCFEKIDGMFALAIFNHKSNTITIARDLCGEKPFYYFLENERFLWASEMKALFAAGIECEWHNETFAHYLLDPFCVQNDNALQHTFYKGVQQLLPGHYATIHLQDWKNELTIIPFKKLHIENNDLSEHEASEYFYDLMKTSVMRRLRADVTVGSSLSGGLDSSVVVAMIRELLPENNKGQKTFSAIFPGYKNDESLHIKTMVEHTQCDAYYTQPKADLLHENWDSLFYHQEEPFGSASIFAQWCVMQKAKEQGVTVLLDGQGADELLGGYNYSYAYFFAELMQRNKALYKSELNAYKEKKGTAFNTNLSFYLQSYFPEFAQLIGQWKIKKRKSTLLLHNDFGDNNYTLPYPLFERNNLNSVLLHHTTHGGLQTLLRYADRNAMAHAREVRLPFLQPELMQFLLSLPSHYKIKNAWTKHIQRKAFENILPRSIAWRPDKIGYEPPQSEWLKHKGIQQRSADYHSLLIKEKILNSNSKINADNQWHILMLGSMLHFKKIWKA